ncbi:MAG: PD-(D/E)XK nuclease family protein [Candidatus Aenigmarchaeota archaeon]|nr:PD-(D/E)XK nuclease family protein [Candidatus Aenigmarchaeota archaeon]
MMFSHSRISTFEQCPQKFKFHYIDKAETEEFEGVEAFLGSRVHEVLEKLYMDLKFQKLLLLSQYLILFFLFFNFVWLPPFYYNSNTEIYKVFKVLKIKTLLYDFMEKRPYS